jgi:broad specificity phosphatase PhoE
MRHGQTDYNSRNLWMGSTDVPLNSTGIRQALVAAKKISMLGISKIYVSPLLRARQTADIIKEYQLVRPEVIVIDELRERCFGSFEGRLKSKKNRARMAEALDIESSGSFDLRIRKALSMVDVRDDVLVVSHSAVYQQIFNNFDFDRGHISAVIENCEIVELFRQQKPEIELRYA